MPQDNVTTQEGQNEPVAGALTITSQCDREIELLRRERELAERELQLQRELELAREMRRLTTAERDQATGRGNISHDYPRANITVIADLLSCFDGSVGNYEVWEKQLRLIKTTYHLVDEHVKILIGMRLKRKASEWLHSKPQYIELSVDNLLSEMQEMYDHRPSKILLRKQFEERVWQREETFHQYVHEKVILANRVPVNEDEIIDYLIDGIPAVNLRDQACMGRFATKASLLQAFEKVTLRDRFSTSEAKKKE